MKYQIKQLAKIAGVSVRTLHYYDDIGLLKPSGHESNGYRYYQKPELLRLQQILFYRELDFPLSEIKKILDQPGFDYVRALKEHKLSPEKRKTKLQRLIKTINKTLEHMTDNKNLNDKELYDPFRDDDVKKYQPEAKLRWGNTEAYCQSMERVKRLTKAEMTKMKEEAKAWTQKIADNMDKGPKHTDIQKMIAENYD